MTRTPIGRRPTRTSGRLFREVEFALPTELDEGERRELALEFAQFLTAGERLPYTLAIHRGRGENPHCHLVISERSNDGMERPAELSRELGKHLGPGAAIETKFRMGERESRSSAVAEAGEIEDRNDQWTSRWESANWELSRVQEELGQLMEELRGVERAIREMAKKIADRARRVFDRRQTGELVRGAFRSSQEPQPESGGSSGELPKKPREPNVCR